MESPFRDYTTYLRNLFGERVQKISVNPGYSCPNRDGSKARHGCTYCNLKTLEPAYLADCAGISDQIEKGIAFNKSRGDTQKFLVYFQSYTNTYGSTVRLKKDYEEALQFPGVAGLVIGTRPDCISAEVLAVLETLSKTHYISVELGIESTNDATLKRVNRCHAYHDTVNAVTSLAHRGLPVGGHLILGFPWESREVMVRHATNLSRLPLTFVKLHHLQILKGTALAREHRARPFDLLTFEAYTALVISFLEHSRPDLVFQRLLAEAPLRWLIDPHWKGIRNNQFTEMIRTEMIQRRTAQGAHWRETDSAPEGRYSISCSVP